MAISGPHLKGVLMVDSGVLCSTRALRDGKDILGLRVFLGGLS